jgi:hypothetical protein
MKGRRSTATSSRRAGTGPAGASGVLAGAHEWVSFPDPAEDRTWLFDVTFLESNWSCIWGRGCQGVLTGPTPELVQGCCSYGAHFTGAADAERVEKAAELLTDEQWQYRRLATRRGGPTRVTRDDETVTRLVDDACIFLNRPGFAGGPGCALHRAALEAGERPLDWKPDVCWQVPLRREDSTAVSGHVTSTVRQWERRDWGEGGAEFAWWCTEATEAFRGGTPVHVSLRDELEALVGAPVYDLVAGYLLSRSATPVRLAHPAVRTGKRR